MIHRRHATDVTAGKKKKIEAFDPSDIGLLEANLFGLPFTTDESEVVVIPMPWEVTVSYRDGTARGPETMFSASFQVDLYDAHIPEAWKLGISMLPIESSWQKKNRILRRKAKRCIAHLEKGGKPTDKKVRSLYNQINSAGSALSEWMYQTSLHWLNKGKAVCVLGGEHSVPLGFMRALTTKYSSFSMLHIDAHADLREAYEGFEFSHGSIQYNASKLSAIKKMVLVGIRDYSEQEVERIASSKGRIVAFPDRELKRAAYEGMTWKKQCDAILKPLSKYVYVSYDIDALDPALCPHTGTPVPGGLEFEQVLYLLEKVVESGRIIIGFDLCEVAPGENDDWDSVVGVRTLYRLANLMARSQGRL